ncbi:MAG: hypothetical protein ACJ8HU_07425 [Chthoniobacterales bacterium]
MLLTSCAYQGVIVQKLSRPHPLYASIGIDGVYSFVLRDSAGGLHRQMVTPEVFESYSEGQFFNDLQAPPAPTAEIATTHMTLAGPETLRPQHTARRAAAAPERVIDAPPPLETTQSFKASELEQSSRSLTATLRTEVQRDATEETNEMPRPVASSAAGEPKKSSTTTTTKKSSTKSKHPSKKSSKAKEKSAATKSAKPWKMTEPSVELAPPSEGPKENQPPAKLDESDLLKVPPPQP